MQERPRIVVYAPHFAEYALRFAMALTAESDVLLIVERSNLRNECESDLVTAAKRVLTLFPIDLHSRVGRLMATLAIPLRIAAFRPWVVHVQEQFDTVTARVVGALRRTAPILMTVHDPRPHTGRDAAYFRRHDTRRIRLRAAAAAFHVHGAYCRAELIEAVGKARPIVDTPHGVILVPAARDRLVPEPGRILLFGRMEAYKGIEVLLDAFDELVRRGNPCRLVLAGRGPELDRLRQRIDTTRHVETIGRYLTPTEAVREFQRASVVVAPYLDATQSGVVSAAFGNGRPVVGTATGGLVDSIRDGVNGLLVEPGRPDLLADALAAVLTDGGLRARLTQGAAAEITGRFDWSEIAAKLLDAYYGLRNQLS